MMANVSQSHELISYSLRDLLSPQLSWRWQNVVVLLLLLLLLYEKVFDFSIELFDLPHPLFSRSRLTIRPC